jgi:heme-degrading monooxygenase HmoA
MATLSGTRIRHLVVFTLRHEEGSPEAEEFLTALRALAAVDGVEELEVVRQVGVKNSYRFAVTMEFASRAAYDAYNGHPDHVAFVSDRWIPEVSDFLEVDLTALRPDASTGV